VGEVFLAAVEKNKWLKSEIDTVYTTARNQWKYTVSYDSIRLAYAPLGIELESLYLDEVHDSISAYFISIKN